MNFHIFSTKMVSTKLFRTAQNHKYARSIVPLETFSCQCHSSGREEVLLSKFFHCESSVLFVVFIFFELITNSFQKDSLSTAVHVIGLHYQQQCTGGAFTLNTNLFCGTDSSSQHYSTV